jgi:hypothetical protein
MAKSRIEIPIIKSDFIQFATARCPVDLKVCPVCGGKTPKLRSSSSSEITRLLVVALRDWRFGID